MTWQQAKRQETRSKRTGKYVTLNPCECCGRSAGAEYYSDERCNTTGHGLVLCAKCCAKLAEMDDAQFLICLGVMPPPPTQNGPQP